MAFGARVIFGSGPTPRFSSDSARRAVFSDSTARSEWVEANTRTTNPDIGPVVVGHDYSNGYARNLGRELVVGSPEESLVIEILIANAAPGIRNGVARAEYSAAEQVLIAADALVAQRARRMQPPAKRRESPAPWRALLGVAPPCSLIECIELHYRGSGDDFARTHACRFRCAAGETLRVDLGRIHVISLTNATSQVRPTDSTHYYAWIDSLTRPAGEDIGPAVVWGVFTRRFLTRYQAMELPIGSDAEGLLIDLLDANAAPRVPAEGHAPKVSDAEFLRWAADRLRAQRARAASQGK